MSETVNPPNFVEQLMKAEIRFRLRLEVGLPSQRRDLIGRLIVNHILLDRFQTALESQRPSLNWRYPASQRVCPDIVNYPSNTTCPLPR